MDEPFYPPPDSQFGKWLDNYIIKVEPYLTVIGITTAEFAKAKLIRDALVFADNRALKYDEGRLEFVNTRQTILYGDETNELLTDVEFEDQVPVITVPAEAPANSKPFITNLVKRTRLCPSLTENKKKEMGVLAKGRSTPTLQANLKGHVDMNGYPVLTVQLLGQKGFEVWRRVTGTSEFTYFDRSAGSSYTDDSDLPDGLNSVQYDYQVRLIGADNEPVSEFSNFVTLTKTA